MREPPLHIRFRCTSTILSFLRRLATVAEEPAEDFEADEGKDRGGDADGVESGGDGHADARRNPDARRGRETVDGMALHHDRARADEADAAHDLRRDPRGIALSVESVARDDEHQRRI